METRTSAEERQRPPVLPVKQRRGGHSSSSADLEGEAGLHSPGVPQLHSPRVPQLHSPGVPQLHSPGVPQLHSPGVPQLHSPGVPHLHSPGVPQLHSPGPDVFPEPTDCQAALCPIHQRYDPSLHHHERFFSDSCPPPVPKKSLLRTLSLPGGYPGPPSSPGLPPSWPQPPSPGWSPLLLAPHSPCCYDNPVYMIASVLFPQQRPVQPAPAPLLPLSQLSFHTPDQLLPHFFHNFSSHASVSQGLQQSLLLFLRGLAEKRVAGELLEGGEGEPGGPLLPQDLLLGACQPQKIGGSLYFRLHSANFPGRVLAAKVSRGTEPTPHPPSCPPHINVQQVLARFAPQSILCSSPPHKPSLATQPGRSTPSPPHEGAIESAGSLKHNGETRDTRELSVASLLQGGWRVTLERDLPQATLEDFVEEGRGLGEAEGQGYERQLGILLLQLARGLQHLDSHGACTCVELHPRDVLLLWPERDGRKGETEGETVVADGEEGRGHGRDRGRAEVGNEEEEMIERGKKEEVRVGALWRKWGTPRVVVAHHTALSPPIPPPPALQAQFGALIQHCLPQQEVPSPGLPPADSPYRPGLQQLSGWLREEGSGLQIGDTVGILQVLLWGPRARLFSLNPTRGGGAEDEANLGGQTPIVRHWLSVKRALLVLKLAEKGVHGDQTGLDWEDFLCLHYLSLTEPESVLRATAQLGLHNTPH